MFLNRRAERPHAHLDADVRQSILEVKATAALSLMSRVDRIYSQRATQARREAIIGNEFCVLAPAGIQTGDHRSIRRHTECRRWGRSPD
jgi:hypothetical protein